MQEESAIELSNQSKERALVGEVISTVALADQISREFKVRDQGIDMEIEFTDDAHERVKWADRMNKICRIGEPPRITEVEPLRSSSCPSC